MFARLGMAAAGGAHLQESRFVVQKNSDVLGAEIWCREHFVFS